MNNSSAKRIAMESPDTADERAAVVASQIQALCVASGQSNEPIGFVWIVGDTANYLDLGQKLVLLKNAMSNKLVVPQNWKGSPLFGECYYFSYHVDPDRHIDRQCVLVIARSKVHLPQNEFYLELDKAVAYKNKWFVGGKVERLDL